MLFCKIPACPYNCEDLEFLRVMIFLLLETFLNHSVILYVLKHNRVMSCKEGDLVLVDVDECVSSELNSCHADADCADTVGSYTCKCKEGFFGNGQECEGK